MEGPSNINIGSDLHIACPIKLSPLKDAHQVATHWAGIACLHYLPLHSAGCAGHGRVLQVLRGCEFHRCNMIGNLSLSQKRISCETSLKNRKLKLSKQSFRARPPSKTATSTCENEAFVRDFFAVRLLCCKTSVL